MTALSVRDRTKFNAALAIIHDAGHNASALTQAARINMAEGWDAARSYKAVLEDFAKHNPAIMPQMKQAIRVIDASDEPTVAKYDAAVSHYIETGDNSAIEALGPTFARDSIALAVRSGELSQDAIGSPEALGIAMGFDPGPEGQAALTAPAGSPALAPQAEAQGETPAPARQVFRFGEQPTTAPQSAPAAPAPTRTAAGGIRPAMTPQRERAWAEPMVLDASTRSASGGVRGSMTGERAARWAGHAAPQPFERTSSGGIRAPMTGDRARRWSEPDPSSAPEVATGEGA